MRVVITDRRFEDDVYHDAVTAAGGDLVYRTLGTEEEVIEGCRDADIIVTFKAPLTRRVIETLDDIQLILRNGAGYDNVNVKAASEHGIPVSNIPGKYCAEELAEHALGLMLAAAHNIAYCDAKMHEDNGWGERTPIQKMIDGTFGIVGLGYVGRETARRARGFGMDVIATDPYLPEDVFEAVGVERVRFEDLLARADCVSLHTQATQETHHLIGTEELQRMKETAVLVNTARGELVDEAALVDAVESGEIWGAGTDVYENEPPVDSPVIHSTRIVCTPHNSTYTDDARQHAIAIARDEIVRAITGDPLRNVVNPDVLRYGTDDPVDPDRYDVQAYQPSED